MAGSSKEPKSGTADRAKHLAQENEKLEARLKAVQEKMGRITTKPTFGDKFKAALLPKKHDPLAKLATEREQILKSLRTNQEQRDALDAQPSVKFSDQVEALGPKNNVPSPQLAPTQSPTTTPSQTVGGRSRKDSLSGEEMPDLSKAYEQVELRSNTPEIPKPMEGRSRRDSLSGEELEKPNLAKEYEEAELRSSSPSISEEESPLRQDVSDGYQVDNRTRSFSVSSEEEENPLRQDVSDGYQVDNRTRSFSPPQQVGGPLRGDVSKGYVDVDVNVNVSSGATSVSQNNPLRGDVSDGYDDVEVGSGQTTLAQEDPLRSNVSKGYADVSDLGESNEGEDTLMREIEDPYAEANEQAKFVSVPEVESQVADLSPEESQVIGPKKPEGTTFKMKSLEKQYLEKEKNAPSTTVKIDGKKVTVHEKEWLFDVANEKMREEGRPEITQEQWDKNLAHKQATTQYFNDEQRSEHEVNVKGGKLQQGSGKMKSGSHVFVMDGEGQIYAKQDITTEMDERGRKAHVHHSSFLAGEDVAGAGELEVRRDGTLKGVTDRSGHYKPSEEQTKQALETLEHQGVSMDNVKFTMDRGEHNKIGGMAKEFLQGQVTPEEQQHRQERIDSGKQVSDVSGVMEKTFKERHNVADEVRKKGESVRDSLKKTDNTAKNEARLQQGMGKVVPTPKKGV